MHARAHHATIWRWHFYAGLFCIPFVLWLALTGSVYLFRPQIEALIDRPYAHLATAGLRAGVAAQAEAAMRAVPGSVLHRYQLPDTDTQAVQVIVGNGASETRVYLDPRSLKVMKTVDEESRLMRIVFRLHGELLIGDLGSYLVELAASWAILMILTGLYLWWPRGGARLGGVVYPRLHGGKRLFWRDLHAVSGIWVSLLALGLILTGLPWAKAWGGYLQAIRGVVERSVGAQDWASGSGDAARGRLALDRSLRAATDAHAGHHGMAMPPPASYAPLDAIVAAVAPLQLAAPVLIAPPARAGAPWTAKSDAADRPLRTDLTLDAGGHVLTRKDFAGRALIDRIVGYGVAAHEGQLFGLANQLLGLATAIGLMLLSVSSVVLWWRRRPEGTLGAPHPRGGHAIGIGFALLLTILGLALPMLGGSMLLVRAIERVVLRRLPPARRWLGLATIPA